MAEIGLIVNVVSALLLNGSSHSHAGCEGGHHHHHGHNLKAAYPHVPADALTSVLAIVWVWLDPVWGWSVPW